MKVLSRTSDGLKRCYNVLITLEEVEQVKANKLREIAKKVKMDGFRPGKVPLDVVNRLYGESVTAESKQTAIDNTAKKILSDEKLRKKFSENSIKIAHEHDFEKTLDKFENIYKRVIDKKNDPQKVGSGVDI